MLGPLDVAQTQEAVFSEDEIKAAFLYHFGTYVQWPAPSVEPVTIGVLGAASVADRLEAFLPNRTIQGRPVEARRLESLDELDGVEMLFIGAEHNHELEQLIERVRDLPVLTVTHSETGLDSGAIVNFQLVEQRVHFEISVPAADRAGLMVSSRLLSAALRVRTSWCGLDCAARGPARLLFAIGEPAASSRRSPARAFLFPIHEGFAVLGGPSQPPLAARI